MSNQTSELLDEGAWARQRQLQDVVLRYLTNHGPAHWDKLCQLFDQDESAKIALALRYLAQWMHITVEDDLVKISPLGAARLRAHSLKLC